MSLLYTKLNRLATLYKDTQNLEITRSERERAHFRYVYAEEQLLEESKPLMIGGFASEVRDCLGGKVLKINNKRYFFTDSFIPLRTFIVSIWDGGIEPNGDKMMYIITHEWSEHKVVPVTGELHEIG